MKPLTDSRGFFLGITSLLDARSYVGNRGISVGICKLDVPSLVGRVFLFEATKPPSGATPIPDADRLGEFLACGSTPRRPSKG